ncbi:5-formyltetrahydrofolate cyclo-ligase [Xanthobacter oligotrophicus]|uniref:5-formyltetrahydrofolate cyclo-ligase n=1 Tax=Xanthobacter oligotrophicus TaxID=2607286 RepID=UPI0011F14C3B|nr:5-formyltetrahydrofolate cyclo-ligase [Xanthobacter oligotrophicus]MCG5236082.1 5-formyltetrahydrofolate cyclo-ligase [Xanthobacter oligotrophicus]
MDIAAEKKRLRALALGRRAAMGEAGRAAASRAAANQALAAAGAVQGRTVALFAPFRDEIDTAPLASALRDAGAVLALPVIIARDRPLLFRRWDKDTPLVPTGAFRIPEPGPEAPEIIPELLLVPLAAFDRRGFRIGYGAGFYDRTLALLRAQWPVRALGFAFACQEVDQVPVETHDEPVDMMVTDIEAWAVGPRA